MEGNNQWCKSFASRNHQSLEPLFPRGTIVTSKHIHFYEAKIRNQHVLNNTAA